MIGLSATAGANHRSIPVMASLTKPLSVMSHTNNDQDRVLPALIHDVNDLQPGTATDPCKDLSVKPWLGAEAV